jgi:CubicO group peptidase (beta-lactamase class C family)
LRSNRTSGGLSIGGRTGRVGFLAFALVIEGVLASTGNAQQSPFQQGSAPCPSVVSNRYPSLAPVLEPIRLKHNLPALGAAIVTQQGVESIGVVGVKRYGDAAPACIDDVFLLGSETKAFTATVLARLIEMGRLSWETAIGAVFRDVPQHPAWASVTLEQLLAHQAGLPRTPAPRPFLSSLSGPIQQQRDELARIVLTRPPEFQPRTFHYSNTGYFLAGVMAERVTDKPWEELVREIIFEPLQMAGAGFGPTAQAGGLNDHQFGPEGFPVPQPYRGPVAVVGPAGTIHASMENWGKFIADMLRGFGGGGGLLKPQTYQRLHMTALGGTYANGWIVESRPWADGPVYFHTGSTTQDLAIAWVAPRKGLAILVATNIGIRANDACFEVKDALLAQRLGVMGPTEVRRVEEEVE